MLVIRQNRRARQKARPAAGRGRREKNKTPERARGAGGHGFLTHRFGPVMEDGDDLLKNKARIERDFFASVSYLCSLYQIPVPVVRGQSYPLNLLNAFQQVKRQLASVAPGTEVEVIATETGMACLATVQAYDTGCTLYYIPVRPLVDLLADPDRQQEAALLLYVFAYLYHVVDIPWFLHTGSFLDDIYEMLESWYTDTSEQEEEAATLEALAVFERMNIEGDGLQERLRSLRSLRGWRKCLRNFTPSSPAGHALKAVAQSAWALNQAYPRRSFWDSIQPDIFYAEYDEERMRPDQYLSFFWDSRDDIYDALMDAVNVSLQECAVTEEPVSVQIFDQPQTTITHSLDFEQKLFTLLGDLCALLNELV